MADDDPLGGFKHAVEYSKSNRAGCKKCKEKIEKVDRAHDADSLFEKSVLFALPVSHSDRL